jgi:hypothetical protein
MLLQKNYIRVFGGGGRGGRGYPTRTRTNIKNVLGKPPNVAKTCYDDDRDENDEENTERHRQFLYQRHIACLNKLYYTAHTLEECGGEDLVEWMKQRWGRAHVMKFVRVNGEMTLRVFQHEPTVMTGDSYDDIAYALNDCLRMEYVKYHLSNQMKALKKGGWDYIDIPLSIYYDGTM